MLMNVYNT